MNSLPSLLDLYRPSNINRPQAMGSGGGSRNPFSAYDPQRPANPLEAMGLGSSSGAFQGPRTSSPAASYGANADMEWLGRNIRDVASMSPARAYGIASRAGQATANRFAPPPPPMRTPYFSNDWGGMRRNIGMPVGGGLGALAGMFGNGMAAGGYGQPQRSPSPFDGVTSLSQLLGMFGVR